MGTQYILQNGKTIGIELIDPDCKQFDEMLDLFSELTEHLSMDKLLKSNKDLYDLINERTERIRSLEDQSKETKKNENILAQIRNILNLDLANMAEKLGNIQGIYASVDIGLIRKEREQVLKIFPKIIDWKAMKLKKEPDGKELMKQKFSVMKDQVYRMQAKLRIGTL